MSRLRVLAARARALKERNETLARAAVQRFFPTTEQKRARMRELARITAARVAAGVPTAVDSSPAAKRKRAHLREIMRAAAAAARKVLTPASSAPDEPEPTEETP